MKDLTLYTYMGDARATVAVENKVPSSWLNCLYTWRAIAYTELKYSHWKKGFHLKINRIVIKQLKLYSVISL